MTLATTYLGLELPHPFMPGASPLVDDLDTVRRLEDAGAAAIVMSSLFEERVRGEFTQPPQACSPRVEALAQGPEDYLERVARIRAAVAVPVIASLNGTSVGGWLEYARLIEEAGANALELNVYQVATDPYESGAAVERRILGIVTRVKEAVRIPLAVKLSPFHTALLHFARRLDEAGADGLILFNRLYQADIDLENQGTQKVLELSEGSELRLRLSWLAILSDQLRGSLAASGGVYCPLDALKAVVAGAHAVQVVSALLCRGPESLRLMIRETSRWLETHGYGSLGELRASQSRDRDAGPNTHERSQYIEMLHSWKPGAARRAPTMIETTTRLTVRDLMTDRIYAVRPDDDLATVRDLMLDHNVRHVPVVDDEENLVGLVSHRDLLRNSLVEQIQVPSFVEEVVLERVKVREVMIGGVDSVAPDTDIREAAQLMLDGKYGCLPVTEGTRLVGILTEADFVELLAEGE